MIEYIVDIKIILIALSCYCCNILAHTYNTFYYNTYINPLELIILLLYTNCLTVIVTGQDLFVTKINLTVLFNVFH